MPMSHAIDEAATRSNIASMDSLPNELVLLIASNFEQYQLPPFVLTNRRLNSILTPLLYSRINLLSPSWTSNSVAHLTHLFGRISREIDLDDFDDSSDTLALPLRPLTPHIKSFSFRYPVSDDPPRDFDTALIYESITALRSASHLRTLSLQLGIYASDIYALPSSSPAKNLTNLSLSYGYDRSYIFPRLPHFSSPNLFPVLQHLKFHWVTLCRLANDGRLPPARYGTLTDPVSSIIINLSSPQLQSLDLFVHTGHYTIFPLDTAAIDSSSSKSDGSCGYENLKDKLSFPLLKKLAIDILTPEEDRLRLSSLAEPNILTALQGLARRHAGQITCFAAPAGRQFSVLPTSDFQNIGFPIFPNLEELVVVEGLGKELDWETLSKCGWLYLEQLAGNVERASKLKRLELKEMPMRKHHFKVWVEAVLVKFVNLEKLVLDVSEVSIKGVYTDEAGDPESEEAVRWRIRDWLDDIQHLSPLRNLREFILRLSPHNGIEDSFVGASAFTKVKEPEVCQVLDLFTIFPGLHKLELGITGHPWEADFFDDAWEYDNYLSTAVWFRRITTRTYYFRRLPGEGERKRVKIWYVRGSDCGLPDPQWEAKHRMVEACGEDLLREGVEYVGEDAPEWSWDEEEERMIRACPAKGEGGCDKMSDGLKGMVGSMDMLWLTL